MASKGKAIDDGKGSKRKRNDNDKTGRPKRKNPGVLQFFDDAAFEIDENESSEDSDFDDDFLEDEFDTDVKVKNEPGKATNLPLFPKEEEMSEAEFEKMLEERYKPGSSFVTYAEDRHEAKRSIERNTIIPAAKDPTIWKVKCMVGRERHSAFCLMQKYVDLRYLGTKLQIISAFALEHVKGFIYIEADKQCDVNEACNGLCSIYSSRAAPVPDNEVSHLLSVRNKSSGVSVGTWARVKNGKYKGDLAQVVAINDVRKKATVKLIPRIDLQAMAEKFGGGVTKKKTATPAPRLISSSELEEFRPLIQYRRDRDTDKVFEVFDGMMLKDGYLYKKVPIDSLSFWGVTPSEDELLKFETPSKTDESNDLEWLSQLYGEQKKKQRTIMSDKGGGKGEGSSSSSMENGFEVPDLVFFGRTGFGVIIGTEKDDSFKILKEGSKGPVVVSVKLRELKKASFEKKFTALDQHMKTISINDTVRVLEGPLEDRQGVVKQIYRGTVFLYDENEQENSGYFCSKAQMCEKIKLFGDSCKEKGGGEQGASGFEDFPSSPKPQERDNNRNFNHEDKDGMFSVGQSLRIKVGPLKGYLCRVLAIRRSDVTVKLDSQHKILTVKCELLSEVRGKSSALSMGEDSESVKPFDLLGTQDGTRDWMDGAGTSTESERWNAGGLSTERGSWPSFPASSFSLQPESSFEKALNSDHDLNKDVGGSAWETKVAPTQNSSWGTAVADEKSVSNSEQIGGWGKSEGGWKDATTSTGFGSSAIDSWGKEKISSDDQAGSLKGAENNWGHVKKDGEVATGWGTGGSSWGKAVESQDKGTGGGVDEDSWGKAAGKSSSKDSPSGSKSVWNNSSAAPASQTGNWTNVGGSSARPNAEGSSWSKQANVNTADESKGRSDSWNKEKAFGADGGSSWSKQDGGSSWSKQAEGSSWSQQVDVNKENESRSQSESWSKPKAFGADGGSSWNKKDGGSSWNNQDGGSSWSKQDGGSSWSKQAEGSDQQGSWGRPKTFEAGQGSGGGRGRGGGRGNACFKCGETGHMSRECPNGGGGGRGSGGGGCYKCGEDGHFARECPSSGGGGGGGGRGSGGGGCYKCGEDGHFARECPSGGGGGGGGRGSGGGSCYKCGEEGHFARECPSGGGGRGGGRGGRDHFGGGSSFDQGQSSGWRREGQENIGTSDGTSMKNLSWDSGQAAGGWGKSKAFDGVKKDDIEVSGWKKTASVTGDQTENWGNAQKDCEDATGWAKSGSGNQVQSDSWNKLKASGADGGSSWNKQDGGSSWNKQNEGSSWSKQAADANTEDGPKGGSSWNKPKAFGADGGSSWNKQDGGSSWSKQDGGSSWSKQADVNTEDYTKGPSDSWSKPKGFGADGGSSWKQVEGSDQQGSWGRPKIFEGGQGSGGGRGRGGGRGNACFKCGEAGHMSRECPSGGGGGGGGRGGGRGGGGGCYKCGEDGHFARECPSGGGGGGGGRGGGSCYKCGEEGHFARECPSSGGGGGGGGGGTRGCYKCGEDGHFARECPSSNS